MQEFNKNRDPQQDKPSFNIRDYHDTAVQTSQAANDIKALVAEIEDLIDTRRYNFILNHLLVRIGGLIVLIFALAVIYRIISYRMAVEKGCKTN